VRKLIAFLYSVLFLLVCVLPRGLVVSAVNIPFNEVVFPDPNFQAWINKQPGWVSNGYLTDQALTTKSIKVYQEGIRNLTGIEHFTYLTELNCRGNQLTTLDVSKNSALASLNCSSNHLTTLDVTQNPALTDLYCGSNQLTTLDVSRNPALTVFDCSWNQLKTLDISRNPVLTRFKCDGGVIVLRE
jgi:hypothetical protein